MNVETPATLTSSKSVCPSTSKLPFASIFPSKVEFPATSKFVVGIVLPIPTFPFDIILNFS